MDQQEFSIFMQQQKKEIEKHKWIESQKAGRDLGDVACFDWVNKYARTFRHEWEAEHCKRGLCPMIKNLFSKIKKLTLPSKIIILIALLSGIIFSVYNFIFSTAKIFNIIVFCVGIGCVITAWIIESVKKK